MCTVAAKHKQNAPQFWINMQNTGIHALLQYVCMYFRHFLHLIRPFWNVSRKGGGDKKS